MRVPVVSSVRHVGHRPDVEVQCGVALPAFDVAERLAVALDAVARRADVELVEAAEHGLGPVHAVHDEGMVAFLATCWESMAHLRPDAAVELLFADTFPHPGLGLSALGSSLERTSATGSLGRYCFDTITGIGPGTYDAARSSADVALTAADELLAGSALAVALTRPPGHHAARGVFGGGTYFNNAAIAAQALRSGGLERVGVLDVDFHHGNGTQAVFYDRNDVAFASLHGSPDRVYPFFTGWPEERGDGDGLGANLNITLPPGVMGDAYRDHLAVALGAIKASGAQAIVVSLGFDTAIGDPAGDARLTADDFRTMGSDIAGLGLPLVAVLEGGYIVDQLGGFLSAWLDGVTS